MNEVNILLKKFVPYFTFVRCTFNGSDKAYTYKTALSLEVNDTVIVLDPKGTYTGVTVVETNVVEKLSDKYKYKWVVAKLDLTHHVSMVDMEERLERDLAHEVEKQAIEQENNALLAKLGPATVETLAKKYRI